QDEAHETNKLPQYMADLMAKGVLGNKTGAGFFKKDGKTRLALDIASGDYKPVSEIKLPNLDYIDDVSFLHSQGRYEEGMATFLEAQGDEAAIARKVIAGYISYAFHRVGEATETITEIDMIMGSGFNWAPPSVLVDTFGAAGAVKLIDGAGLPVPKAIIAAAESATPTRFFNAPSHVNTGKFFVAG
ncbi:MAG: 3-hydroxyacyl-CoA dehydrogenase, partial [Myxococcota bacterium]